MVYVSHSHICAVSTTLRSVADKALSKHSIRMNNCIHCNCRMSHLSHAITEVVLLYGDVPQYILGLVPEPHVAMTQNLSVLCLQSDRVSTST